jgi:hypothetical protein
MRHCSSCKIRALKAYNSINTVWKNLTEVLGLNRQYSRTERHSYKTAFRWAWWGCTNVSSSPRNSYPFYDSPTPHTNKHFKTVKSGILFFWFNLSGNCGWLIPNADRLRSESTVMLRHGSTPESTHTYLHSSDLPQTTGHYSDDKKLAVDTKIEIDIICSEY